MCRPNSSDEEQSDHGLFVCFIYLLITMKDWSLLSIGKSILKLDT